MLKAIETKYKGCRFRSRLEARWAVFFDTLGITWEYEKEGYDLGAVGRYLPDFWLPAPDKTHRLSFWVEIKPIPPTHNEFHKGLALAALLGHHVFFACGVPGEETIVGASKHGELKLPTHLWCAMLHLCTPRCGARAVCRPYLQAVDAARSARFEHGETPKPNAPTPEASTIEPTAIIRPRVKAPPNRLSYLLDYVISNIERWQFVHEGTIYTLTVDWSTKQRILETLTNGLSKIDKGQIEVDVSLPAIFAHGKPHHIFVNINRDILEHLNGSSADFAPIVRLQSPKGHV